MIKKITLFVMLAFVSFIVHAKDFVIVGSLIEVGYGRKPVEWIGEIFAATDRTLAGPTAQPDGLYLVDVIYPQEFNLPKNTNLGPFTLI